MSISNLSATANDTLHSYGKTAVALIDAYRAGGNRILARVDAGWQSVVNGRESSLSTKLREDLVAAQREITGYFAKGLQVLTAKSASAVHIVVKAANTGVDNVSDRVERLETAIGPTPLSSATVLALPFVEAGREIAGLMAQRAAQAVSRIEGVANDAEIANVAQVKPTSDGRKAAQRS
jgi:hypothetical protein